MPSPSNFLKKTSTPHISTPPPRQYTLPHPTTSPTPCIFVKRDDDEEEEGTNKANAHFPKYAFAKPLTYKYITKSSFHFPKLTLTRI